MKNIFYVSGPLSQRIPSTLLVMALHNIPFHSFFKYSDDLLPRLLILEAFSEIAYTDHLPPDCR